MKIAVYGIALNEERFAERWAKSAAAADYRVVVETNSIRSAMSPRQSGTTKPAPIPSILCGPDGPPDRTGDSAGSTATSLICPLRRRNPSPMPRSEAAVPTLWTKRSIRAKSD